MDSLTSYLPASILSFLLENSDTQLIPPFRQDYETVVLFADVSGFTALCEAMAAKGPTGDEQLAKHLNSYFEVLNRTIGSQGGDVFKFAGDAILVVWPPSEEDLTTTVRRAAQCAIEIKDKLQDVQLENGLSLNVKVGVGVGPISILHIGGSLNRMEYIATGQPLIQAFESEGCSLQREVILSPECWARVKDYFVANLNQSGHAFLKDCKVPVKKTSVFVTEAKRKQQGSLSPAQSAILSMYVPAAVLPFVEHHEERWAGELRRITVLFVNLGIDEAQLASMNTEKDLNFLHKVLVSVQNALYKYEGSLNKFLMDDKGSTLIAIYGLPPLTHEDDSIRGVFAALEIFNELATLGLTGSIGITSGNAQAGIVGNKGGGRREYSVLGDTVNLSARLMQYAGKNGGGVVCDTATQYSARHRMDFVDSGQITVKGKSKPLTVYKPIIQPRVLGAKTEEFHKYCHDPIMIPTNEAFGVNKRASLVRSIHLLQKGCRTTLPRSITAKKQDSVANPTFALLDAAASPASIGVSAGSKTVFDSIRQSTVYMPGKEPASNAPAAAPMATGPARAKPRVVIHMQNKDSVSIPSSALSSRDSISSPPRPPPKTSISSTGDSLLDNRRSSIPNNNNLEYSISIDGSQAEPPLPLIPSVTVNSSPSLTAIHRNSHLRRNSNTFSNGAMVSPLLSSSVDINNLQPVANLKTIKVLLPDLLGHVTISAVNVFTIEQVKAETLFLCSKRNLIPDNTFQPADFYFCLDEIPDVHLPDNLPLCELDNYQASQKISVQKNYMNIITKPLKSITANPHLALRMCKSSEEFRSDQMRRQREMLLESFQLFQKSGDGASAIVIEGEVGLGKTRLVFSSLQEVFGGSNGSSLTVGVYAAIGDPHEMIPFNGYRDVFTQLLDEEIDRLGRSVFSDQSAEQNRQKCIAIKLASQNRANGERFIKYLALLNEILDLQFVETDESRKISNNSSSEKHAIQMEILIAMLKTWISKSNPMLFIIDDALFLDSNSWLFAARLMEQFDNLMQVFITRPLNKSYLPAFSAVASPHFSALLARDQVVHMQIHPRSDEVIYQIACETLGERLDDMPTSLSDILLQKAQGNPLAVKELIFNMKKDKLIEIDGLKVAISPAMAIYTQSLSNATVRTPIPITVQNIIGSRLDRLTHLQRMILKCGALIGETFTFALLEKIFPLHVENEEKFRSELDNLFQLNLLKSIDPIDGATVNQSGLDSIPLSGASSSSNSLEVPGSSSSKDPKRLKFVFVSRFVRDMVLARMLEFQRKDLDVKIAESRTEIARRKSEGLFVGIGGGPSSPSVAPNSFGPLASPPSQPFRPAGKPENVSLSRERTSEFVGKSAGEEINCNPNAGTGIQSASASPSALTGSGSGSEFSHVSGSQRSSGVSLNQSQYHRSNSIGGGSAINTANLAGTAANGIRRASISTNQPEIQSTQPISGGRNSAIATAVNINPSVSSISIPISRPQLPRLSVVPGLLTAPTAAAIAAAQQFQPAYESIIIIHERPLEYFLAALTQKQTEQKQREQKGESGNLSVPLASASSRQSESLSTGSSLSLFTIANSRKSTARPMGSEDQLLASQAQQKPKFTRYYKDQQFLAFWDSPQEAKTKNYMFPTLILDLEEAKIEPDPSNLHSFSVNCIVHYQVGRDVPEGKYIQYSFEWRLTAIDEEQYEQWGRILFRRLAAFQDPDLALQIAIDDMSDNEIDDEFEGEPISEELRGIHSFQQNSSFSSTNSRMDSLSVTSPGPVSTGLTPSILSLSQEEREGFEKKFLTAVENEKALAMLPVQLCQIHKHEIESKSIFNKFHTDWKKRYVLLTEDLLSLRKKEKWILPVQAISLVIGQAEVEFGGFESKQKLFLFKVSADLWFKKGVTQYTRKTLIFGMPSEVEARNWVEAIQNVIKLGSSRFGRRFAKHARASTWGQNNPGVQGSIIGSLGVGFGGLGVGGQRMSGSRRQSTVGNIPPPPANQSPTNSNSNINHRLFVNTVNSDAATIPLSSQPLTAPLVLENISVRPPAEAPESSKPRSISFHADPNPPALPPKLSIHNVNNLQRVQSNSSNYCDADTDESENEGNSALTQSTNQRRDSAAGSVIQIQLEDSPIQILKPPVLIATPSENIKRVEVSKPPPLPAKPPSIIMQQPNAIINALALSQSQSQLYSQSHSQSSPPPLSRMSSTVTGEIKLSMAAIHQAARQEAEAVEKEFDESINSISQSADPLNNNSTRLILQSLKKRVVSRVKTLHSLMEKQEIHLNNLNHRKTISSLFAVEDLDESTKLWLNANFAPATQNVTAAPTANNSPRHSQKFEFEENDEIQLGEDKTNENYSDNRLSPIPLSLSEYQNIPIGDISSWDFNLFDLPPSHHLPLLVQIFSHFDCFSRFNIRPDTFVAFYKQVEENYLDVPFHSILHAIDVCQTAFALTSHCQAEPNSTFKFSSMEMFALLVAATCFPESDSRILTNRGWLFLPDIELAVSLGEQILFAAYDIKSESIVYVPGRLKIPSTRPQKLINFTQANERNRWSAGADEFGERADDKNTRSNNLTIRVTGDHGIFHQHGWREADGGVKWARTTKNTRKPNKQVFQRPYGIASAQSLLPARCLSLPPLSGDKADFTSDPADWTDDENTALGDESNSEFSDESSADENNADSDSAAVENEDFKPAGPDECNCKSCAAAVRFLSAATNGINNGYELSTESGSNSSTNSISYFHSIGVPSELIDLLDLESVSLMEAKSRLDSFLELYGFWLGIGSMNFRSNQSRGRVRFSSLNSADRDWIKEILPKCGLKESEFSVGSNYDENGEVYSEFVAIHNLRWNEYFSAEYGRKYQNSQSSIAPQTWERLRNIDAFELNDSCVNSSKWFYPWVLKELNPTQIRLIIRGLHRAEGTWEQQDSCISTYSPSFRDELLIALLHCGFTAHFTAGIKPGTSRGYQMRGRGKIYNEEEIKSLKGEFNPITATNVCWRVMWSGSRAESACLAQPSLLSRTGVSEDDYDETIDGRIWCVEVEHSDHLIIVQRAHREKLENSKESDSAFIVTKAGRPVIIQNCHDIRHPGNNNLFQINSRSPLAQLYSDVSVLEQHHSASTFRLLSQPDCNLLANLSAAEYKSFRNLVTNGILETDLARHAELMAKFNSIVDQHQMNQMQQDHTHLDSPMTSASTAGSGSSSASASSFSSVGDSLSQSQRSTIFNLCLHAADISNPSKPWEIAIIHSNKVFEELLNQGDLEKSQGLPISPNADRLTSNQDLLNINFIDFIVAPTFVALRQINHRLSHAISGIEQNRARWAAIHEDRIEAHKDQNKLSLEEFNAEKGRWARRTETFYQLINENNKSE